MVYPIGTKVKTISPLDLPTMHMVVVGYEGGFHVCVESDIWPLPVGNYTSFVARDVDIEPVPERKPTKQ